MSKPIALVDMDGTLADYDGYLIEQLRALQAPEERAREAYGDVNGTDYYDAPHIRARVKLIRTREGFWLDLPPLRNGFLIVECLVEAGFDIHVLTKGPRTSPNAWTEKVMWCEKAFGCLGIDHKITITEDKGLVYGKVLVDDYPAYIKDWLAYRPRGQVIMPAHSWNASFTHPQVFRFSGEEQREELRGLLRKLAVPPEQDF